MSMEANPASATQRQSLVTLTKAISVEGEIQIEMFQRDYYCFCFFYMFLNLRCHYLLKNTNVRLEKSQSFLKSSG